MILLSPKKQVQLYKEIRDIVQEGFQYRLSSVNKERYFAVQYLTKDKNEGVIIYLRNPRKFGLFDRVNIKLKGLEDNYLYGIYEGIKDEEKEIIQLTGKAFKERGFIIEDSYLDFFYNGKSPPSFTVES